MTDGEKPSYRLDRSRRLKLENVFRRVYRFRVRVSSGALAVCCAPTAPDRPARLGISVSKRVVKKAFLRNRWKRLIREAFRLQFYDFPQGFDFIAIPRRQDPFPSYSEVATEFLSLARRAARKATDVSNRRASRAPETDGERS